MHPKLVVSAFFALLLAGRIFAGTNTVVPTTTLAAETGNNTSAASTFTSQSNGNLGAGNVSKVDTRTLLYSGSNTPIYAHFMGWFGQSNHMNVGYTSSSATQVKAQVSDALSRGISGFILDWYGPNNSMPNNTAFALMNEAQSRGGSFHFGIMYDGGALGTCASTSGCNLSQQAISDLTYAYNNFEVSSAYMTSNGRPIAWFFAPDRYGTLNWSLIASSVPGNPLFIFQNSAGFTHANSSGSFSWVMIDTSNAYDWSQSYLDNFYLTSLSYPHELTYGTGYKGFNDTLAPWGANRIMYQQCGQVWMDTLAEIGKDFSTTNQLYAIQLVTWNDYEEGSELETGIDNCVDVAPVISGNLLSWTATGSLNTIDHFTVFISSDGQHLMSLGNVPATSTSFDLTAAAMAPGSYTLYVKAVGRPTLSNKMSPAVGYTVVASAAAMPTFSPGSGTYSSAQSVTMSSATTGATIYYTTDGSTPMTTSAKYVGPITVSSTATVKAIATATGYTTSNVGSASYTIQPALLPRSSWSLLWADSQETVCYSGGATKAFDGSSSTMWHTQFCGATPSTPHEIQINLGAPYTLSAFQYLPRQDGCANGWIKQYEFYVSTDGVNWGTAVATGTFNYGNVSTSCPGAAVPAAIQVTFPAITGQYVRLRSLSEINGNPWTTAAEMGVIGVPAQPATVSSLALAPSMVVGGTASQGAVTLTAAAPSGGAQVTLTSNSTASAVPATVTVPAGAMSASFAISTSTVTTTTAATISASYGGVIKTGTLQINAGSPIPQSLWVVSADSQETNCYNGAAANAIDGNSASVWHTQYCGASPSTPHQFQINLGASHNLTGLQYLPRQDGCANGWIKDYEVYVSTDGVNWPTAPVASGTFNYGALSTTCPGAGIPAAISIAFPATSGQYLRLRAVSEINGNPWISAADLEILGL